MKHTEFYPPSGKIIKNITNELMYKYIVEDFKQYWSQGTACAEIHYFENEFSATLSISVNLNYGFYLNYSNGKEEEKLSVFDFNKLDEIIEGIDDLEVSLGLFLPPELAWKGIKEFLETGTASKEIEWISSDDLPQNARFY